MFEDTGSILDEEMLTTLFRISSPSNKEDKMQLFIKSFLTSNKIDFQTDSIGNIFQMKIENVPLLSSHLDTVEDEGKDGPLMKYIKICENKEYGRYLRGYGIIGGDDKCGIFIMLSLLAKYNGKLNFIFSVNEEHGMSGIREVIKTQDFSKILYGIILDRRGSGDIICVDKNYGTKDFEEELKKLGTAYGYAHASGASSDANYICEKISCANISVGYYNPHSRKEFVIVEDLENAMNFTEKVITTLNTKFKAPEKVYASHYDGIAYNYKSCKICFARENTNAVLKWAAPFKGYLCTECAGKIVELTKDDEFVKFATPVIKIETTPEAKPIITPTEIKSCWYNKDYMESYMGD